jgi:hypothetical protein
MPLIARGWVANGEVGTRPMAITLPSIARTPCKSLMACASLSTEDKALLAWMEELPMLSARYKTPAGTCYVRVIMGGVSETHFHVDVVTEDYFEGRPPKTPNKLSEVMRALERVEGLEAKALWSGKFWLSTAELPPVIRSTLVQSVEGDVSLKMIGGRLMVRGAPIHAIEWGLRENEEGAFIDLDAIRTVTVGESYLKDALALLVSSFDVFVTAKDRHASTQKAGRKKQDS